MRLIDGDEIEELFREVISGIAKKQEMTGNLEHMVRASAMVIEMLHDAPTVDAVPVVRCADCIRFRPDDEVWGWCTVLGKMRLKDYCSYGVRKDGDGNG